MTRTFSLSLLTLLILSGCEAPPAEERVPQLKLPGSLQEISGLTLNRDGDVLAVADERADIYRIRFDDADVTLHSRFGDGKSIKGDFEGITIHGETLYIVTSEGELFAQPATGSDGRYEKFDTGLKKVCELEGLTAVPDQPQLLLLCKTPYKKGSRKRLLVHAWSIDEQRLDPEPWLNLRYADLDTPRLHPSGISFNVDGNLIIIAAKEQRYLVLTPAGELLRQDKLPNPHVHLQTEGVVVTSGNTLYLADEGQAGRGTITRYERFF